MSRRLIKYVMLIERDHGQKTKIHVISRNTKNEEVILPWSMRQNYNEESKTQKQNI